MKSELNTAKDNGILDKRTSKESFVCVHCGMSFRYKSNYLLHLSKVCNSIVRP